MGDPESRYCEDRSDKDDLHANSGIDPFDFLIVSS